MDNKNIQKKKPERILKVGEVRISCKDQFGIKTTRLIDAKKLTLLETEFNKTGGSLVQLLLDESEEMKVKLLNKDGKLLN